MPARWRFQEENSGSRRHFPGGSERKSSRRIVRQDAFDQLITHAALFKQRRQSRKQPHQTRLAAVTVPVAAASHVHTDDDLVGELRGEPGNQVHGWTRALLQVGAKVLIILQRHAAREQGAMVGNVRQSARHG